MLYGPAAEIFGVIINAMYGKCLSNIASKQYFNLGTKEDNNFNDNIAPQQQPDMIYAIKEGPSGL